MVEYDGKRLNKVFCPPADPTRRAMLQDLATAAPRTVSELAAPFDISLAGASERIWMRLRGEYDRLIPA
jgi:hypothetical protein